ncbi:MAG: hypothetical protein KF754_09500 [Planctomycetes bacterium]|nr:hypothetical protein [Planctomycetota bacterium]
MPTLRKPISTIAALCLLVLLAGSLAAQDVVALRREADTRRAALAADDVKGRHELAKWCAGKKLRQSELSLYREIVRLAPGDEPARKALGHVRDGDQWFESVEAMNTAKGRVRGLTGWLTDKPEGAQQLHEHWLAPAELTKLEAGESLLAHKTGATHEVLTLHWRIRSGLKEKDTLELARVAELAVRQWRQEADLNREADAPALLMELLRTHEAYVAMIQADIETFDQAMVNSHGFFDGRVCWGSFFKDWYRTRRIVLHEARHQFDLLVAKTFRHQPAWYREGTAEFYSIHDWDGKTLQMGRLNSDINEHLYFLQRICKRKKLRGAEPTLMQGDQFKIDPEFYQQSWAFVYFCRTGKYAEAFKKWETDLLSGKLQGAEAQWRAFAEVVATDAKAFDKALLESTEKDAAKFKP